MALKFFVKPSTETKSEQPAAAVPAPAPEPPISDKAKDLPPWEASQTVMEALHELAKGRQGHLLLVHNSTGAAYIVESFDPETGIARLTGGHGMALAPRMTARENALYHPRWR